ncbi:MAG: DUF4399 domain-containing protein [Bacteroidia bacterium]
MKKNVILLLTAGSIFLWGCGNNSNTSGNEGGEEAVEHGHDHEGHDHNHGNESEVLETIQVPEGAKVFFANLNDGDTISSPVKIEFGLEGMDAGPAGELIEGVGHHHLIIDGGYLAPGDVVPADDNNIHYGQGQTEAEIELTPGAHTLTMQFADGYHQSLGEQMSATISVFVEGEVTDSEVTADSEGGEE